MWYIPACLQLTVTQVSEARPQMVQLQFHLSDLTFRREREERRVFVEKQSLSVLREIDIQTSF